MNTPSDKPATTEFAHELRLLRETLLLGFGIFFALAGWLFRELERGDHTFSSLTLAAATLFLLLLLRQWWKRLFKGSELAQAITFRLENYPVTPSSPPPPPPLKSQI